MDIGKLRDACDALEMAEELLLDTLRGQVPFPTSPEAAVLVSLEKAAAARLGVRVYIGSIFADPTAPEPEKTPEETRRPQETYATFGPSTPEGVDTGEEPRLPGAEPERDETQADAYLNQLGAPHLPQRALTAAELGRVLNVSDSQVYRWINDGAIEAHKPPDKSRGYIVPARQVRMLRAILADKPAERKLNSAWINKRLKSAREE